MKTTGLVVAIIGGLMTLSGISNIFTMYDMSSSHDASVAFGGIGVSVLMLVVGLVLYNKGKNKEGG